jgi:uncharacterized repeat protein (TIGR01451 family)
MRYSQIFKRFRRSTHLQMGPILCLVLLLDIAALPSASSMAGMISLLPVQAMIDVQVDPIDEPEQPPPDLPAAIEPGEKKVSAESVTKPAATSAEPELPPVGEPALKHEDPTVKPGGLQPIETLDDPTQAKPVKQVPALADDAPRDDSVQRTQNEAPPLGAPGSTATPSASSPSSPPPGSATVGSDPNAQYRSGAQGVGIYVEVVGPPSANLQQETTFRIIVRNAMRTQAFGVVVKDILPDTLEYVKSQPEAKKEGSTLAWDLGEMPIGSEKTMTVVAKPVKVGSVEHTATVTCQTGTKARLVVQEPKLKVEQSITPAKPLKGQPVQLRISVSNPGTGAARNVAVVVKVSQGLQDSQGSRVFDQEIRRLGPGERMELQPLTLSTVGGGAQTCEISTTSADVATEQPTAKSSQSIEILEPKLKLTMTGPSQKYTNTEDIYELNVQNPGTAPARNLKVAVFVPDSKGVRRASRGGFLNKESRRLEWTIDRVEPGESKVLKFEYRVEAMGTYPFSGEIRADSGLMEKQSVTTTVTGVADVDFQVAEKSRIIDVGDSTEYVITVRNQGTKDAVNLLISAILSENLQVTETDGHDGDAAKNPQDPKQTVFPKIDHLPAGQELTLVIRVKAIKAGISSCSVFLHHEDLGSERLEKKVATPRVTDGTQITSKATKPPGQ